MPNTAKLHGIEKHYTSFTLGPIDWELPAGMIVGLVGENGAGKTTLLKMLCGALRPDAGQIALWDTSPADAAARARIGAVFEDAFFPDCFTARQVGKSLRSVFGARWSDEKYNAYLHNFALDGGKPIKEYSRGMRMKLSLAAALAHDPELLVLDEATSGLDPVVRGELLDLLLDYIQDERRTVLLSSHITTDLEQIADRIAYLHRGRLLFCEDKDELLQQYGLLRCAQSDLARLPAGCAVYTRQGAYGCETLVKNRAAARAALPDAVCDHAGIDDIMRFTSGRDDQ